MRRRSAVGRLAATVAGLSLGKTPDLEAAVSPSVEPFAVTRANLAESSGMVTCPICQEMADSLDLTPAGPCLRCADRNPALRAEPYSDQFWTLSPREVQRVEAQIQRLGAEVERLNRRLASLAQQQMAEGGDRYDRAMEAERDRWHGLQRELHLLHLLRAASRQYAH
jgi:hypothetical protein